MESTLTTQISMRYLRGIKPEASTRSASNTHEGSLLDLPFTKNRSTAMTKLCALLDTGVAFCASHQISYESSPA